MEIAGVGLGLRFALVDELLEREARGAVPAIRWLEMHPENYIRRGGRFRSNLDRCRERWPLVTHGLAMSLGAVDPLEREYLKSLRGFSRSSRCVATRIPLLFERTRQPSTIAAHPWNIRRPPFLPHCRERRLPAIPVKNNYTSTPVSPQQQSWEGSFQIG